MSMSLLVVLFLLPLPQQAPAEPKGDPGKGKVLWQKTEHVECRECHGTDGEGGLGPDLAGRGLTRPQFIQAVRKPWGIMPAYVTSQISDEELNDIAAYFDTLPAVTALGAWRRTVPAGASKGLAATTTSGCSQCHHPAFNTGRAVMGAINADFAWFGAMVYGHTANYPLTRAKIGEQPQERLAMGNFSPARLPEPVLRDMWDYIVDLGFRPRMQGHLSAGVPSGNGVTYKLNVKNTGVVGAGLTAEDLTVNLTIPAGATVVAATGAGYQGVRRDEQAKADVAVWAIPRMAPQDQQSYTLTLSQAGNIRGTIRWTKPTVKTGPSDSEAITAAPAEARPQ
jgi:cytochrome c553